MNPEKYRRSSRLAPKIAAREEAFRNPAHTQPWTGIKYAKNDIRALLWDPVCIEYHANLRQARRERDRDSGIDTD